MMTDIDGVKALWNTRTRREDPIHVYINSPFCYTNCRYCLYKGNRIDQDSYGKYYKKYLPDLLHHFSDLLRERQIDTVYFGGGTPNVMDCATIERIVSCVPGFQQIKSKVFEVNPAYVTPDQLRLLKDLGFTLLTFGVQSFYEPALLKQNRKYSSFAELYKLISFCKENGIFTSVDLMCYLYRYNRDDLAIFRDDLKKAMALETSFITVYPELNLIHIDPKAKAAYEECVMDFAQSEPMCYYPQQVLKQDSFNERSIVRFIHEDYAQRFFNKYILTYYANDFPYALHNIIGFGDLHCRQKTMSYSPGNFFYTEVNNAWRPGFEIQYIKGA